MKIQIIMRHRKSCKKRFLFEITPIKIEHHRYLVDQQSFHDDYAIDALMKELGKDFLLESVHYPDLQGLLPERPTIQSQGRDGEKSEKKE